MCERPEWLGTQALRDYVIAIRNRDRWVPLGLHYAPGFLMGGYKKICDVYGVRLTNKTPPPADLPRELRHLNEHYFTTDSVGLTDREALWQSETLDGLEHPVLWRVEGKAFYEMYAGQEIAGITLADWYWAHPHRRNFERVVIVPRGARS